MRALYHTMKANIYGLSFLPLQTLNVKVSNKKSQLSIIEGSSMTKHPIIKKYQNEVRRNKNKR